MVLSHHGIKGQKWGVRRYENYDGTLTPQGKVHYSKNTIRKGTVLNSVIGVDTVAEAVVARFSNKKIAQRKLIDRGERWMYTYLNNNEWDNKVYKGPFSKYLAELRGKKFIVELQYKTLDDIKMPSKKERIAEFKKLYNKNKDEMTTMISSHILERLSPDNDLFPYKTDSERNRAVKTFNKVIDGKEPTTASDWNIAYEAFNRYMERSHLQNSTKQYSKNIQSKYGGMIDDNNKGTYNNAINPIVIFNVNKSLEAIGQKVVPFSEIDKNVAYVKDSLKKLDKEMLL